MPESLFLIKLQAEAKLINFSGQKALFKVNNEDINQSNAHRFCSSVFINDFD